MEATKYKIISKVYSGIELIGFNLMCSDGSSKTVKPDDDIKLARVGKLRGCEAILDTSTGSYVLYIDEGYDSIETSIKEDKVMQLSCRLMDVDTNKCIGYKAIDKTGKTYRLSINKTWELASNGLIKGIKAKVYNKHKVLLSSDEIDLDKLPKLYN